MCRRWHTVRTAHNVLNLPPKLFDIQMICSYTANRMTRQLKDHCSSPRTISASYFSQLLLLTRCIIMLDMSIRALRQNTHLPRRLYVIRGWRNLQIPLSFRCSCWGLEEWPTSSLLIKVGDWVCLRSTQRGSLQCTSMLLEIAPARSCNPKCA